VNKTLLLISASLRAQLRWARQHVYAWLVLAPVVLGTTYFTAVRLAENLPDWQPSPLFVFTGATLFTLSLFGLSLSRASAEIYHLRRPESYFDALPVSAAAHMQAALAMRAARTLALPVVALIVRATFGNGQWIRVLDVPLLLCFVVLVSLSEAMAALNWIHWGHRKSLSPAIAALVLLLFNGLLSGLILAIVLKPASRSVSAQLLLSGGCVVWILIVNYLTHRLNERWRAADIEYARRLESSSRRTIPVADTFKRRLSHGVAAQLSRDLRLTARAFSSALYVVIAVAALCTLALVAALTTEFLAPALPDAAWLDATWLPQVIAIKVACVLAVVSLSALLPVLIAYELPHLWLERAAGTTGLELLRAKICYARIITLLAPLTVWSAGMLTGKCPLFYALPLLAECLWLWWLVSSLMGALSFEMPTRPDLAIIVLGTLGLALGLLASLLWPVGLVAYPVAMHSLAERGQQRARYYLITEAE